MEQTRPGVFRIPMEKVHLPPTDEHHPNLSAGHHPRVGNWSDSELWDREVKSPINNLDNYMYTMPCQIGGTYSGTQLNGISRCVFDTTTSISSTFEDNYMGSIYATEFFDSSWSDTFTDLGVSKQFWSIGL